MLLRLRIQLIGPWIHVFGTLHLTLFRDEADSQSNRKPLRIPSKRTKGERKSREGERNKKKRRCRSLGRSRLTVSVPPTNLRLLAISNLSIRALPSKLFYPRFFLLKVIRCVLRFTHMLKGFYRLRKDFPIDMGLAWPPQTREESITNAHAMFFDSSLCLCHRIRNTVIASRGRRRDSGGGGEFHFQSPSCPTTCPTSFSTLLDIQEWKSKAVPVFASSSVLISPSFRVRLGVCIKPPRRFRWSNGVTIQVKSHNSTLTTRHFDVHLNWGDRSSWSMNSPSSPRRVLGTCSESYGPP